MAFVEHYQYNHLNVPLPLVPTYGLLWLLPYDYGSLFGFSSLLLLFHSSFLHISRLLFFVETSLL